MLKISFALWKKGGIKIFQYGSLNQGFQILFIIGPKVVTYKVAEKIVATEFLCFSRRKIIGAAKMRNNYDAIKLLYFFFLLLLYYCFLFHNYLLYLLCFIFGISQLLLFYIALLFFIIKLIAKSFSLLNLWVRKKRHIYGDSDNWWEAIKIEDMNQYTKPI